MLWSLWGGQGEKMEKRSSTRAPSLFKPSWKDPRTEAIWLSRVKGTLHLEQEEGTPKAPSQSTCQAGPVHHWPAALSGSLQVYLVFTYPSPDVTGRGIRHPCSFTNLRGATLMWICQILLREGLVSAGEAFRQQCRATDKIINGDGWRGILYIKGWEDLGDIGSCW